MKIYNRYILTVASSLLLTTVVLIAWGQKLLDFYYAAYIIEALIITELYVHINTKARRGLTLVSALLFAGFVVILSVMAIRILL